MVNIDLFNWLDRARKSSDMNVQRIGIDECTPWRLCDGVINRPDRAFFEVVSMRDLEDGSTKYYIDQREIGVLAFIMALTDAKPMVLLQMKEEPGNVGLCQLAPTVQATYSNYVRRHGGEPTLFLGHVFSPAEYNSKVLADSLQSEQGTKFFKKRNRNLVLHTENLPGIVTDSHQLFELEALCDVLDSDFSLNTDARSVLTSCDWDALLLGTRSAFTRVDSEFSRHLFESFYHEVTDHDIEYKSACNLLEDSRQLRNQKSQLLAINKSALTSNEFSGQIAFIEIETSRREVARWRQPIWISSREETHILLCSIRDGRLAFLIRASRESGLRSKVEFGPTFSLTGVSAANPRAEIVASMIQMGMKTLIEVKQSDEGGRFFQTIAHYRVVEIDHILFESNFATQFEGSEFIWVSARTLNRLLMSDEMGSNELRSVTSLMLKWL